jgi:acetoin utilization deacetylase AcuC-like enzyme
LPHGTDDAACLAAFDQAVPVVRDFATKCLVVSLGFD